MEMKSDAKKTKNKNMISSNQTCKLFLTYYCFDPIKQEHT